MAEVAQTYAAAIAAASAVAVTSATAAAGVVGFARQLYQNDLEASWLQRFLSQEPLPPLGHPPLAWQQGKAHREEISAVKFFIILAQPQEETSPSAVQAYITTG